MKPYILFFLIFNLISPVFSQTNCTDLFTKSSSKASHQNFISSKNPVVISNAAPNRGFEISVSLMGDMAALQIKLLDNWGCIELGNIVFFSFADGSRKMTAHQGTFNCDQTALVFLGAPSDAYETFGKMSSTRIKSLYVKAINSSVKETFTPEQADALINQLNCLKSYSAPILPAKNTEIRRPYLKRNKQSAN